MTSHYISDSHVHTRFSTDSDAPVRKTIEAARTLGMEQLTITDHQDFGFSGNDFKLSRVINEYFDTLMKYRDLYSGDIRLSIGCEVGLEADKPDVINTFVASKPFDFIIGSSHLVTGIDIYYPDFYEGKTRDEALRVYFQSVMDNLKVCSNFDVYGHLDYILRYCPEKNKNINIREYFDVIGEILTYIIKNGKGIEINTGGYSRGLNAPNPSYEIICLYRSLGGKIITFASDAHTPDRVGAHFEQAAELAKRAGFKEYYTYIDRIPISHRL